MPESTNPSSSSSSGASVPPASDADAAMPNAPAAVSLGDGLDLTKLALTQNFAQLAGVKRVITTVPARKPSNQQFIRVRPGEGWGIQALTLSLKDDGEVYFVHPDLYGDLAQEVRPKHLYLYATRDGSIGLWPVNMPSDDGRLDAWSQSAHTAAKLAQTSWIRMVANRTVGAYEVRQAASLAEEPVWPELTMREILNLAFRDKLIKSLDHPIIRGLRGEM